MYKYILFDLDGTLFDTSEGILRSVQYALAGMGRPVLPPEELCCFIGPPLVPCFAQFCGIDETEARRATAIYRERYSVTGVHEVKPYDGIEAMLAALTDAGCVLAVATGKPAPYSPQILSRFGFDRYFSAISTPELDGRRSEKCELIGCVLEELGVGQDEYDRVLMIGDRDLDIIGAHEVGIAAVGVRYGFSVPGEFEAAGAEYIVDSVQELHALLLGEGRK